MQAAVADARCSCTARRRAARLLDVLVGNKLVLHAADEDVHRVVHDKLHERTVPFTTNCVGGIPAVQWGQQSWARRATFNCAFADVAGAVDTAAELRCVL